VRDSGARTGTRPGNGVVIGHDRRVCFGTGTGPGVPATILQACLLPLVLGLTSLTGPGEEGTPGPMPLHSEGEIAFLADGTVFRDAQGVDEVHFYISLPPNDLDFRELEGREGRWAEVDAHLTFLDARENPIVRATRPLEVPEPEEATDTAIPKPHLVWLRVRRPERAAGFEIKLEDRNAVRRGLIHQLQSNKRRGIVRGVFRAGGAGADAALSPPLFLWAPPAVCGTPGPDRGFLLAPADIVRADLDPNPGRSYGLVEPALTVYMEAYGLGDVDVTLRMQILDITGTTALFTREETLRPAWDRCGIVALVDVSALPTGTYQARLELRRTTTGEADDRAAVFTEPFQMLWNPESWRKSHRRRVQEAALLLGGEDWERYQMLQPGQQQALLDSLWAEVAGPPGSARSATVRERFDKRVALADARYSGLGERGSQSDRGRVLVRFGEPDEVHKELMPDEQEQIYYYLQTEFGSDRAAGETAPHSHWLDNSSYEVWSYMNNGSPILGGQPTIVRGSHLRFIFLDEMGMGRYRLIYSNLLGGSD